MVYEAMECLGGNGYVEDGAMARLYREAPVNAIWEGSGNVMGLDVLRAFARDGEAARAVVAELANEAKGLPGATEAVDFIGRTLAGEAAEAHALESNARAGVECLYRLAAAAALATGTTGYVAGAFARSRLEIVRRGSTYGAAGLPKADVLHLFARILPNS
jgi:putative acyl-CoA dehydrogenase